jgi:hypothetical protein
MKRRPTSTLHRSLFAWGAALAFVFGAFGSGPARADTTPPGSDPYVEQLVQRARNLALWQEVTWLRLGHYRTTLLGGYESEVDGGEFFLATDGKTNPRAELEATLRAFFWAPVALKQSAEQPFCRFPARLLWLSKVLEFDWRKVPPQPCPDFAEYIERLSPQSFTVVFSSYYLNNPASAFGHTFLRVNKGKEGAENKQALLDYAIDFSATVDTTNSIIYAAKGLLGMFPGVYRRIQYFYKVREYNDYESRDIWEYELDLTPEEVVLVTAHIWELGHTYFDYYYLDENCSYHILGALEVARPSLTLLKHVNWPAIPADTIRALHRNPGLVRSVHYRPSARTSFTERLAELDSDEVDLVADLMSDPQAPLPRTLSDERRVKVLDAALDVADSMFASELIKEDRERDVESTELQQALLERRARILVKSDPFELTPPVHLAPHLGHDTRRVGVGSGYSGQYGAYHQLGFRLALHDLADPARGYPEAAQIEFLPFSVRYFVEKPQLWLEDIALVRVVSTSPWSRFELPLSWTVHAGWDRFYDRGCRGCLATTAEVGGGLTLAAFAQGLSWYAMGITEIAALAPIRGGVADLPVRAAVGVHSGVRLRLTNDLVLLPQGRFLWLPEQDPRTILRLQGTLRYQYIDNFALDLDAALHPEERRVGAASLLYF